MRGGNGTKHRYVLDVLSLIELEREDVLIPADWRNLESTSSYAILILEKIAIIWYFNSYSNFDRLL